MKTRLQRLWSFWLDLPQGMRPGALIAVFIVVLALISCLWPRPAHAEMLTRNGDNWLRLYASACRNDAILSVIREEWREHFRSAHAQANGQEFDACWIEQDGKVFVLFDDGDKMILPLSAFKDQGA
jgi:hypothetical protein